MTTPRHVPVERLHDYAVSLIDQHPEAAAIGVAFADHDDVRYGYAAAVVIPSDHGEPITAERMIGLARDGAQLRQWLEVAAIRAVQMARHELDRALAG